MYSRLLVGRAWVVERNKYAPSEASVAEKTTMVTRGDGLLFLLVTLPLGFISVGTLTFIYLFPKS